jgi:hypothetical protein
MVEGNCPPINTSTIRFDCWVAIPGHIKNPKTQRKRTKMTNNNIRKFSMATLGALVLATSLTAPATAMPSMPADNAVMQDEAAQVILVGGKHRRNRHWNGNRYNRHGNYNNRHNYGYDNYRPHYYGDCYWRKNRYWDGHGYYFRPTRVCR